MNIQEFLSATGIKLLPEQPRTTRKGGFVPTTCTCDGCDGTGVTRYSSCHKCGGTGKLKTQRFVDDLSV